MFKSKKSSEIFASPNMPKTAMFSAPAVGVLGGIALIAVAGFLVYLPCLNGPFIMDDDLLVSDNSLVQSQDGLHRIWCTTESLEYYPLTYSIFWIEWRLWGTSPDGYHVTSLILQIVESLLIWMILRKLSIPGAFLAALIFAVHPVNVESVAWIAQLRNMLALLFFQLSILWYFKAGIADGRKDADAIAFPRRTVGTRCCSLVLPKPGGVCVGNAGEGIRGGPAGVAADDRMVAAAWQDEISCERPRFS